MLKVYILQGECLVEDEDGFENIGAFTTQEKAQALLEALCKENTQQGFDVEYKIEVLDLE